MLKLLQLTCSEVEAVNKDFQFEANYVEYLEFWKTILKPKKQADFKFSKLEELNVQQTVLDIFLESYIDFLESLDMSYEEVQPEEVQNDVCQIKPFNIRIR